MIAIHNDYDIFYIFAFYIFYDIEISTRSYLKTVSSDGSLGQKSYQMGSMANCLSVWGSQHETWKGLRINCQPLAQLLNIKSDFFKKSHYNYSIHETASNSIIVSTVCEKINVEKVKHLISIVILINCANFLSSEYNISKLNYSSFLWGCPGDPKLQTWSTVCK